MSNPALAELKTVLRGNLERTDAWLTLANLQMRRGETAETEALLREPIAVAPVAALYESLGLSLFRRGHNPALGDVGAR